MKINRENIAEHLIEYQLGLIGKTIDEVKEYENWFNKFSMTDEDFVKLKSYAIPLLKKVFKCNKSNAEKTFDWFNLQFGLRIENKV